MVFVILDVTISINIVRGVILSFMVEVSGLPSISSERQFCSFTIDFYRHENGKSLIFKNYKDSIGSIIVGLLWLSSIIGVAFFCV